MGSRVVLVKETELSTPQGDQYDYEGYISGYCGFESSVAGKGRQPVPDQLIVVDENSGTETWTKWLVNTDCSYD